MKLIVSHRETKCFTPRNQQFHAGKQKVSNVETKSALQREQRFQIPKLGERNAEMPLSKGLTAGCSLNYRTIYACKQPKTMGKKSYIFCYP
ncbi:hypothetical protein DW691_14420 [Bacteroides xylanisolvens]|uniref:Uncharacterized protein n=2 Tax=Bacteroides TaxID=816 RepID=A0A415KGX5_9BACE|nr:hypothetical protein HMPREF9010_00799 [Bacteroides sp. 3_1_23]KAA3978395.1 hypothetical protein F3F61_03030 [Bacteroides ovatus]KAA9048561.1 hypothetical protein F6S82_07020 [Bacteroides xylanisolvens]RJX11412.1 hypothetical protein DXA54_19515 [Bacteroides sp. OF03-11BH]KAB6081631.1 hypothetical protein GA560_14115 [Bacteroides xylanisolvens]